MRTPLAARITVNWGYEPHSITLTPRNWRRVKSGKPHRQRGVGFIYEAEFYWDYWEFAGGLEGELRVGYGKDGGEGYLGWLRDARIDEFEYRSAERHLLRRRTFREAARLQRSGKKGGRN